MIAVEALAEFDREQRQRGCFTGFVVMVSNDGLLTSWLAKDVSEEVLAQIYQSVAKYCSNRGILHQPQGRA